jgi:ubiquinone/menaquinone biosynthesis C-methylase UbiE
MVGTAFDQLAARYDALWSDTAIGRRQREAVWRCIDPLFERGEHVLDLGCGTGCDALHLLRRGVRVHAIDASAEMLRIAQARGVTARRLPIEDIGELRYRRFDGALSNFGAFNCVPNLDPVARTLASIIRPGGYLAVCIMGRVCAWETLHYLRRLEPAKAFRRWSSCGAMTSLGVRVTYPSVRRFLRVFRPYFKLIRWAGIGLSVPPSYVSGISEQAIARLAAVDRRLAHLPGLRALCDHRLLILQHP